MRANLYTTVINNYVELLYPVHLNRGYNMSGKYIIGNI